jgi:hypothetical protein
LRGASPCACARNQATGAAYPPPLLHSTQEIRSNRRNGRSQVWRGAVRKISLDGKAEFKRQIPWITLRKISQKSKYLSLSSQNAINITQHHSTYVTITMKRISDNYSKHFTYVLSDTRRNPSSLFQAFSESLNVN